jgi:hypothetical protein
MFKKVIAAVRADTGGHQQPWSEASIQGDFYFRAAVPGSAPASVNSDPEQIELAYWESIRNSRNPEDFRAYLKKYPHGDFAGLAANRLKVVQSVPANEPIAAPKTQSGKRCEAILERVQLGDTLNEEDSGYLKDHCK